MGNKFAAIKISNTAKEHTFIRKAGDLINSKGLPQVHVVDFTPPYQTARSKRMAVCRCWQSEKFPLCDNSHQQLQRQGLKIGPIALEIRQ